MSDLRQRWDLPDAADGDELDDEDGTSLRNQRLRGFVRFGVVAVVVFGLWIALSMRQNAEPEVVEAVPSPRGVVAVPDGYEVSAVLAPDLSMTADATGVWALLAEDAVRVTDGPWVVVACREAGSREARNANGIVTATLGADLVIDATDEDGVRVAATRAGDITTAMVLDRRPTWIVTVIAGNWDGDATELARTLYGRAADGTCDATAAAAAAGADLPLRQERSLGVPVLPVGLRLASADETTVGWVGDEPGETIVLTSQRPGTGGDDADLISFLRPAGDGEAEVLVGSTPAYRADNLDGSEALVWQRDGVIHTLSLGAGVDADVVAMAGTFREPDDLAWQALIDAAG